MKVNDNGVTIITDSNMNYIHTESNGLQPLSKLVSTDGWQRFLEVLNINDHGKIVGYGFDKNGNYSGFILTPQPGTVYAGK